jgi:hypothetical protein
MHMNALIELGKLALVTKGDLTPEVANVIGDGLEAGAERIANALDASTMASLAAEAKNLLEAAEIAMRIQKADPSLGLDQLVAALLEKAQDTVLGSEEEADAADAIAAAFAPSQTPGEA